MKLRLKIFIGFLILAVVLTMAEIWSIYQVNSMRLSVQETLDANYKGIQAAQRMLLSLRNENEAILQLLQGKWKEGRRRLSLADSAFQIDLRRVEKHNQTDAKRTLVNSIKKNYGDFRLLWEKPIVGTKRERNLDWYARQVMPKEIRIEESLHQIIRISNRDMYKTGINLKNNVHHIIMPGVVAMLAAIIYLVLFNFFIDHYLLSPIVKITKGLKNLLDQRRPFEVEIETDDEVAELASTITTLVSKMNYGEIEE
ncbi:MAG: hypothetical protein GXO76_00870 [Calditrichaeota bacterium]|nr:hypothetical protein [Calditrichota bacterium]